MPRTLPDNREIFTLFEIVTSINETIQKRYTKSFWVETQVTKWKFFSSGHCYPEFYQRDGDHLIAKMEAVLWKSDYNRIMEHWAPKNINPFKDGSVIYAYCRMQFDGAHGVSLRIFDIEIFDENDFVKERKATLKRLVSDGVYKNNINLRLPSLIQNIAVITSKTGKGWLDFKDILSNNPYRLKYKITVFEALTVGEKAVDSITEAMELISAGGERYDAVLIIRAGGGEITLQAYNNYKLAKKIAECKLPVLTGIGHANNQTAVDQVACKSFITPSDLASFLLETDRNAVLKFSEVIRKIVSCYEELYSIYAQGFDNERALLYMRIEKLLPAIKHSYELRCRDLVYFAQNVVTAAQNRIEQIYEKIKNENNNFIIRRHNQCKIVIEQIVSTSKEILKRNEDEQYQKELIINRNDVNNMFAKGLVAIKNNGGYVKNLSTLKTGDTITIAGVDGLEISANII